MAKQIQFRGGTTAQHSVFTGAIREITVDTDKDTIIVHDGTTVGGFPLARESIVTSELATKVVKNANIVAGTGTKITYDTKGLVTGSTTLSASDIPSLDASKITSGTLSVLRGGTGVTTSTGTGNVVLSTSPTLITPNIGVATGSLTGNASTATTLQTAITINGVSFNGSANIVVPQDTTIIEW